MPDLKKLSGRWQHLKKFDKNLIIFWSILSLLILFFHRNLHHFLLKFAYHVILIGLVFWLIPRVDKKRGPVWHFFRYWYIVISFPFLYLDVGTVLHLVFPGEFDYLILHLEKSVFGVLPNVWILRLINPYFTELMQVSYSIYWITIPLGAVIFYIKKEDRHLEQLLHYVTITFFISYFCFIFFPVAGPRFVLADQITTPYMGIFITRYLRNFVTNFGYRGGAFPSSHVGVAVVILVFVWHFKPKIARNVLLPLVTALSLATIYGQYHYVSDVIAGLTMGLIIGLWGARHSRKILDYQVQEVVKSPEKLISTSTG